jgi:hypothetical protein
VGQRRRIKGCPGSNNQSEIGLTTRRMETMERKDKYAGLREATDDEIKASYRQELIDRKGEAYVREHEAIIEASWQYILELGFNGRHFVLPNGRVVAESDLDGGLVRRVATGKRVKNLI